MCSRRIAPIDISILTVRELLNTFYVHFSIHRYSNDIILRNAEVIVAGGNNSKPE